MTRLNQRRADRLGDEVDGADGEAGDLEAGVAVSGDEDDRDVGQRRVGFQGLANLEAAHVGRLGIEQDEVGRLSTHPRQRHFALSGEAQIADAGEILPSSWIVPGSSSTRSRLALLAGIGPACMSLQAPADGVTRSCGYRSVRMRRCEGRPLLAHASHAGVMGVTAPD